MGYSKYTSNLFNKIFKYPTENEFQIHLLSETGTTLHPGTTAKQTQPRTKFRKEGRQSIDSQLFSNFRVEVYYLIF